MTILAVNGLGLVLVGAGLASFRKSKNCAFEEEVTRETRRRLKRL
ncbi:hypothetical protein ASZ90_019257 [hydrocarbon metagenome]|uniref:Uncharacterized protein n=1 Tax=hydrocarbon metagenome TaxID=938273 RepID=A0A0W8E3T1_9ZZZZ